MLKIVFAGTPNFTLPVLDLLIHEFSLVGVLTAPCKRQGRKMQLKASAVHVCAEILKQDGIIASNVPIFTPEKLDDEVISSIEELKPDLLVCFAYGKLFPKRFMSIFPLGGINIHPSLLPKWRGPSPIPFAIYSGDVETGISIQTIKEKMDSGDILIQEKFKIERRESTEIVLSSKVAALSAQLLGKLLLNFDSFLKNARVQNEEEATYTCMIKKEDGLIDWTRSAIEIERQILAFTPWPGTYTFCDGKKLNIIDAIALDDQKELGDCIENLQTKAEGCVLGKGANSGIFVKTGNGVLCIRELQWQTKKVLKWKDFINGTPSLLTATFSSKA